MCLENHCFCLELLLAIDHTYRTNVFSPCCPVLFTKALPATVEAFKSTVLILVFPAKFTLSFPFVFHTLGGFRHIYWDTTTNGIDNESAKMSSIGIFAASGVLSYALASYSF